MEMEFVETLDEIRNNMRTLDRYLNGKREPEYSYALSRIKRGTCFVADNSSGAYRFYPSRFIGYVNNTMSRHENNEYKNGRETNPAISAILGRNVSAVNFGMESPSARGNKSTVTEIQVHCHG